MPPGMDELGEGRPEPDCYSHRILVSQSHVSSDPGQRDAPAVMLYYGLDVSHGVIRAQETVLGVIRSEEHTSELQSLMRISYAVFCLKKKITHNKQNQQFH